MTYLTENFTSAAAVKKAVKEGRKLTYFEPGLGEKVMTGTVYLEGPHYPKPHTWYLKAEVENGIVVKVK